MEKYESKQYQINRAASEVYPLVSDFRNFTPLVADKVEGWTATEDECSFTAKGLRIGLRIAERRENELVKFEATESSPIAFTAWFQLVEVAERDTRMRITLHVELNMMMRMMLGSKLRDGVDQLAEQIAEGLNSKE